MSKKEKPESNEQEPEARTKDRPPGPTDRVLDNGLVYGRWYGGAPQDCPNACRGLPEGLHVPPCPLNTSERAPVKEAVETVKSDG